MKNLENIKKYNKKRIDITNIIYSDSFRIRNYLNDREVLTFISLGVPCGAIQSIYNGKDISHREKHELSDSQMSKVRQVYVPINTIQELIEHQATHFCSYTIHPDFIEPSKMQTFMYRFDLLSDSRMDMFNINETNNHQIEMLNDIPLTYDKLEKMRNKYITPIKEKEYIEKNREKGLIEKGFYIWLDGDESSNFQEQNKEEENETEEFE